MSLCLPVLLWHFGCSGHGSHFVKFAARKGVLLAPEQTHLRINLDRGSTTRLTCISVFMFESPTGHKKSCSWNSDHLRVLTRPAEGKVSFKPCQKQSKIEFEVQITKINHWRASNASNMCQVFFFPVGCLLPDFPFVEITNRATSRPGCY